MYNEEIKQRFIEDYSENDTTKVNTRRIFSSIAKFEKKCNKDVYQIDYTIIAKNIFNYTRISSYRTYYQYISTIKMYKQWCMMNDTFPGTEYFPLKTLSDLELKKYYSEYMDENVFRSFAELHKYVDPIFEIDINKEYIQKQEYFKLMLLLLYHGIHEKDIFQLKTSNIIIKKNGVFVEYKDRLLQIIDEETERLLIRRTKHGIYEVDRGRWTEYIDLTDYIFNFGGEDIEYNKNQVRHEMARAITAYNKKTGENKKIKIFNIYVNGAMRYIKEDEKVNSYKIKIKELYKWFEEFGYPDDISTPGKKKIIKETYKVW